ncbi:MAG: DUF2726 domain-containing protein, partial [Firmicutes bacterium]|nr:DUF2726 domain-containing protein [Bacillota bacterium]
MAGATVGVVLVMLFFYLIRPRDRYPYERRELLTKREAAFYEILAPICARNGWMLLIKLRLADVVKVQAGEKKYMSFFNRIKAKHTDFILVDPETLEVLAGVELDDPSHEREDRIERDEFVDHVYEAAGIPLLHVWMPIEEEELEAELLEWVDSLADEYADEADETDELSETDETDDSAELSEADEMNETVDAFEPSRKTEPDKPGKIAHPSETAKAEGADETEIIIH